MFSEKDMEDAIVRDPGRYLGEDGLELVARQYRVSNYIFDLLFTDRHGSKLIVEIQKGTLDRNHQYKILDYYDGFREKHPEEFIELMVLANHIPTERKRRLRAWGVEYREVPETEFVSGNHTDIGNTTHQPTVKRVKSNIKIHPVIEEAQMKSYQLFKDQKNRFVEALLKADTNVTLQLNWKDVDLTKPGNWFIEFIPNRWGVFKQGGFGIHFSFKYYRDRTTKTEYVRLPVGVERPLKPEFVDKFKDDVIESLKGRKVTLPECELWPNVSIGGGRKLLDTRVVLDDNSWEKALDRYSMLDEFVDVVADVIKHYYNRGCFTVDLDFPV